jgi:sugar (pentulose or hexulose) kinase
MKVNAIFDMGKTNKKFFLFDSNYQEVYKSITSFEEIEDEDGFPCDDLQAIESWVKESLNQVIQEGIFNVRSLNFSTYGASWVHLDKNGKPLTPLYNYLKPIPEDILASFYDKYGDELTLAKETSSAPLGMLNSGLQLYWLKHTRPEVFANIRWSLHFPQYLSYLFTSIQLSEFTSIGCHTFLWDYGKRDYHSWVYAEDLAKILPPVVNTGNSIQVKYEGKNIEVGAGIHDSSAALLPYIQTLKKPFLLVSTGTWSISINPFNHEPLTEEDLKNDCLSFLSLEGKAIKVARLFLGYEYSLQVEKLSKHFDKEAGYHREMRFNPDIYAKLKKNYSHFFHFEAIQLEREQPSATSLEAFQSFEEAYHQLMMELVELQIQSCERAIGNTQISKLFIDGGFADNEIFVQLLTNHFQDLKIRTTESPLGSALGAAMAISDKMPDKHFLRQNYKLKKHKPLIQ